MLPATTRSPSVIFPDALYTKRGCITCSGISETRIRQAAREGINCRRLWVGKRSFYRGRDIILFIEELAAAEIRKCTTYTEQDE